jgi:hypothetical protein
MSAPRMVIYLCIIFEDFSDLFSSSIYLRHHYSLYANQLPTVPYFSVLGKLAVKTTHGREY